MTRAALPRDEVLMDAMRLDKKVASERLHFVLPEHGGQVVIRDDIDSEDVLAAWSEIRA